MDISAIRSLRHPGKVLTPLWTQVVKYHVSQAFYRVRSFATPPPTPLTRQVGSDRAAALSRRSAPSYGEGEGAVRFHASAPCPRPTLTEPTRRS